MLHITRFYGVTLYIHMCLFKMHCLTSNKSSVSHSVQFAYDINSLIRMNQLRPVKV